MWIARYEKTTIISPLPLQELVRRHSIQSCDAKTTKKMIKPICNYFSFGYESRVGLRMERMRQKSMLLNWGMYALHGTKSLFWDKAVVMKDVVDRVLAAISAFVCYFLISLRRNRRVEFRTLN